MCKESHFKTLCYNNWIRPNNLKNLKLVNNQYGINLKEETESIKFLERNRKILHDLGM